MPSTRKAKDYLNNRNLLEEIVKSQAIQKKYPKRKPAECLTNDLVIMLTMLVDRYGEHYQWRGYTWNEDMRGDAMLALCRVALKFDQEKAGEHPNPFGYYTQIVKRVFLTTIDKEKKQGRIKDDIIEMSPDTDLLPSFGRQHEDNDEHLDGTKLIPSDPKLRRRKRSKK